MSALLFFLAFFGIKHRVWSIVPVILPPPIPLNLSQFDGDCPNFPYIENAHVQIESLGKNKIARVTCYDDFDLIAISSNQVYCDYGQWNFVETPKCERRCSPPPYLENGRISLDQKPKNSVSYRGRTIATYSCSVGYNLVPEASRVRICEDGKWTGDDGFCEQDLLPGCLAPKPIENGYVVPAKTRFMYGYASVGQSVRYQCNFGFYLVGNDKVWCGRDGVWEPDLPTCQKVFDRFLGGSCDTPTFMNSAAVDADKYEITAVSHSVVEVGCSGKYRNRQAPCQTSKFFCKNGKWFGSSYPQCELVEECLPPFPVAFALIVKRENIGGKSGLDSFPIHTKLTYECLKGYVLEGNPVVTCMPNGCWEPSSVPVCIRTENTYFIEMNNINAVLISTATGAGVLGVLLIACLMVTCRKRRAIARAVSVSAPTPSVATPRYQIPGVVGDRAALLHHPDRLALIAFADGVQSDQNALPSYDEATRLDRSAIVNLMPSVNRLQCQRPHWPNLVVCRSSGRNRSFSDAHSNHANPARQGSVASHTPSTRSGADSMGSTDTMALSEGSTNFTLDTASSHSAVSQNPSCRVHCGSLASFDACSVINTEDVPLLEESELEDNQLGGNDMENPIAQDNVSSKMSTNSAPVMST